MGHECQAYYQKFGHCKSGDLRLVSARVAPAGRLAPDGETLKTIGTSFDAAGCLINKDIKGFAIDGATFSLGVILGKGNEQIKKMILSPNEISKKTVESSTKVANGIMDANKQLIGEGIDKASESIKDKTNEQ